jgi:hypothetical protein
VATQSHRPLLSACERYGALWLLGCRRARQEQLRHHITLPDPASLLRSGEARFLSGTVQSPEHPHRSLRPFSRTASGRFDTERASACYDVAVLLVLSTALCLRGSQAKPPLPGRRRHPALHWQSALSFAHIKPAAWQHGHTVDTHPCQTAICLASLFVAF